MRYLKIYEEFKSSSDFNKRMDYVIDLFDEMKDILLPITDNGVKVNLPEGGTLFIPGINVVFLNSIRAY
mgnify:CR=1 FL=1